ncbi:MAG TPA: carboxypeptidase-like regulatory domain-containing protein, partial [Acidobacteriota bacterium]|nr:carboxypeptidase-like regulatory domain-containing protein [Acidobacteriota bacterium]
MLRFVAICLVVVLHLFWPSFGFFSNSVIVAQSTYGSIVGTVSDQTDARIGGATVEIINAQTGLKRTVYTDADGNLLIINLDAGFYEITVSAPYFRPLRWPDVQLLARQTIRFDFILSPSDDCIVIDVPGTPTTTDTPTISDSKSGREINALALNFRATNNTSPIVVATLAPGVQQDRDGNISIAGSLPYMTSVSIDGISTLNSRFNGPVRDLFPSVESIAEFKVSSFNNSAEFGQVTDLTTTSRSGQNEFHGSAFWFHQNRALNATDPFAPSDPARPGKRLKPALVANSFGGNLSGPISIPNFYDGRNRSFFFFNYEGVRRPNQTLLSEIVPPDAFRAGDLSSISTPLLNPFSGQPFARNQVPVNPTSARILELLYPRQNQATGAAIQPNFVANVPGAYGVNGFDLRGDHAFSERKTVFTRYSHKNVTDTGTDGTGSYNLQNGTFSRITEVRNLAGSFNWIFTPKVLNEFRAGLSRSTFRTTYPLAADGGDLIQSLGLTGLPPTPASGGIPNFNFTDGTFISTSPGRPRTISNRTIQFADNLSWVKGRHTLKFG